MHSHMERAVFFTLLILAASLFLKAVMHTEKKDKSEIKDVLSDLNLTSCSSLSHNYAMTSQDGSDCGKITECQLTLDQHTPVS